MKYIAVAIVSDTVAREIQEASTTCGKKMF
jgi:hypothetical protein